MEEFEHNGIWWLPQNPQAKISGTLNFHPGDGATLHLIGSFKGLKELNLLSHHSIILGITTQGKRITLHDCLGS